MKIFSDIERTDPKPASHGDSHALFLDRVAGPYWDQVRELVEEWFSRLPDDAKADVRGRMRSKDDRQSKGAFFELYLHECLLRMGHLVTCHPVVEGTNRRPDFLAEKDGDALYVEARSASPSDVSVGASARANAVYESLDKVNSPNFFLWIDVERQGDKALRARPFRSQLEEWLKDLDPDAFKDRGNGRRDFPGISLRADGWKIQFHAIPKSPAARGKEGVRPLGIFGGGRAFWVQDQEGIRGALSDKGSAYGTFGAPYVVAVASNSISTDDYDVKNVLYGTEALLIGTGPGGETHPDALVRKADGYWYRGDHWGHRHVSGVLMVKQLHPAFVGSQTHTLWAHPDPEWIAPALPIWRRSIVSADGLMTFEEPSLTQSQWFDLGEPWPVGDPFPREGHDGVQCKRR